MAKSSTVYTIDEFGAIKKLKKLPPSEIYQRYQAGKSSNSKKASKPPKPPKLMIDCPICNARVRSDRLEKHKEKVHNLPSSNLPNPPTQNSQFSEDKKVFKPPKPMTNCPICNARVRSDRLEKHKEKVHNLPSSNLPLTKRLDKVYSKRSRLSNQKSRPVAKKKHEKAVGIFNDIDYPQENLYQSSFETRYGNKYLGQMRRDWDGTFGSLPLHDDYDDEAGAD